MKTLLSLALEVGDAAVCESVLGKRLYAQHVESRISQNVCVFSVRDHDKLRNDYLHIRSSGRPAWVAMAYARSQQQ